MVGGGVREWVWEGSGKVGCLLCYSAVLILRYIWLIRKGKKKKKKFSETDGKKKHTYTHINRGET